MSWHDAPEPAGRGAPCAGVDGVVSPRPRDLGGFEVRRLLPSTERRAVGPFVFWDHFGPAAFLAGHGMDVRPHPHIGLATVTYLMLGEILHRDSLGSVQPIRPGAVNWMTAGRGIVHSERTPPERRAEGSPLFGIQAWVALPRAAEECDPEFRHHAAADLPVVSGDGVTARVLVGAFHGARSPLRGASPTLYVDVALAPRASVSVPPDQAERAVHVADGRVEVGGTSFGAGQMLVLRAGETVAVTAPEAARVFVLGGDPLDGPRHVWWNFVSSSRERIEQAKEDWRAGRFAPVPGETERIPLPAGA